MLRLEQLGHVREDSLVAGVITMFSEGYWFIGSLIFLFSVVFPPVKLIALGVLSFQSSRTARPHHARVYRAVELLGKWSMLDVMLVALLVAFVKLGDLIDISPGHGVIAFAMMVFLSLLSGLLFNPRQMWSERTPSHA
jgi:paraquat-inducible protein A